MGSKDIGNWFLPNNKENSISGNLTVEDSGKVSLEVPYGFSSLQSLLKDDEIDIIHGYLNNGKNVTLFRALQTSMKFNMPGFPVVIYSPDFAVFGGHYESVNEVLISELSVRYTNFSKWVDVKPFDINLDNGEIQVNYKRPESIIIKVNENESMEFKFDGRVVSNQVDSFSIEQTAKVTIRFTVALTYVEALESASDFANFLTLCTGVGTDILDLYGKSDTGEDIKLIVPMSRISKDVKEHRIYIKYSVIRQIRSTRTQHII